MTVHTLEIRRSDGSLLRLVAIRDHVAGKRADYTVRVLFQTKEGRAVATCEFGILKFPRGHGVEALLAEALRSFNAMVDERSPGPAIDDDGQPVEVPEPTLDDLREAMHYHYKCYREFGEIILDRSRVEGPATLLEPEKRPGKSRRVE